jgi:3-hydroxyisobutyrate dehydrogenase-like beta-hydroxyacid dehydrogenase
MKVGFIGFGSLGAPIARRLARSGFEVVACDIAAHMLEAFDEPGTKREASPMDGRSTSSAHSHIGGRYV